MRELENLLYVEKLRDPSSSSLKKKRFQGDFIAAYNYLLRGYREIEARLFLEAHSNQASGNRDFYLFIYLTMRVVKYCNRLSRGVVESPS